jgi:hypothetical protein
VSEIDRAVQLASSAARIHAEYKRAAEAFMSNTEGLRRSIIALSESLEKDMIEAALRAVVAIHQGDEDRAYAYAVMSARCAGIVQATDRLIHGSDARGMQAPSATANVDQSKASGDAE